MKNLQFLRFIHNNNNNNYHNQLLQTVFSECTEAVATSLIPHSYQFPGICAFIIDFRFTVWTKKSAKKVRKQVRGCLQNLYQSVAIHLKYVFLVLL